MDKPSFFRTQRFRRLAAFAVICFLFSCVVIVIIVMLNPLVGDQRMTIDKLFRITPTFLP